MAHTLVLVGRCARHTFGMCGKLRCHGNGIFIAENQAKILWIEQLPQFLTNAHETWHTHWSWWEDVQDILFGCVEICVAMVTAYLL